MKRLLLLLTLLLAACTDSLDDSPETRTVYFFSATLEKTGREVRIMVDSTDTRRMGMIVTTTVRSELNLSQSWLESEVIEQQLDWYPFYNVILDWWCAEFRFNCGPDRYGHVCKEVFNFSRQERITSQHIDIVIGGDGVRRMFDNDLSQLPIDKTMEVPYDWGTSRE